MLQLLEILDVSPHVVSLMLGEPDYWAPGDFASHVERTTPGKLGMCSDLMLQYD
jgi:hypothetical protein